MNLQFQNRFGFKSNYGFFVGRLSDNAFHKHYAIQLSLSQTPMEIKLEDETHKTNAFFVNSNIQHQLSSDNTLLTILINPISPVGHLLHLKYRKSPFEKLTDKIFTDLSLDLIAYETQEISFEKFCVQLDDVLMRLKCNCQESLHISDDRISRAIAYLNDHFEKTVSLNEIAEISFLSPSRFLHLFKEKTNLNFRRYQLWNRLVLSLPELANNSITSTAHKFGFTDSSHYTRTFKETFGLTPKFLLK